MHACVYLVADLDGPRGPCSPPPALLKLVKKDSRRVQPQVSQVMCPTP